jgi:hypothetical protein
MKIKLCENKNKSINRQLNGIHLHQIYYLIIIAKAIEITLLMLNSYEKKKIIKKSIQILIIIKSEYGNYPEFPKARALQYNKERGQAYLLCSGWVQELPCRYGRHTRPTNRIFYEDKLKSRIEILHTGFRLDLVW